MSTLVDGLKTQAEIDFYAPFIGMLATAACARENNSNISTAAMEVSRLIYKGKVKAFAEKLWCKQHESNGNGDEDDKSQDKSNNPDPPSKGEEDSDVDTDDGDDSDPNNARHRNGAKSQQPKAVTPPTRASEES